MGLFTKQIGTVFLKESNQAEEYVRKLKDLQEKCSIKLQKDIDNEIMIAQYGIKGEERIAFELRNSGMDMYVLQDMCLEYGGSTAQIDYMIVTRKRVYIVECKNLIGDVEVNSSGEFIRNYNLHGKMIREGTYSPITQNIRHLQIIKEIRKNTKSNIITKEIFERHFEDKYKSIVVLANPKTILNVKYAKREMKEQIVRADQLIRRIKEMDKQVKSTMSQKEMLEIVNFFLEKDNPDRTGYEKKYENFVAEIAKDKKDECKEFEVQNTRKADLIVKLKAFRLEQSRLENSKPYYIFRDEQMEDLIAKNPKNKEELCNVSGFGKVKVEKYGDIILDILSGGD